MQLARLALCLGLAATALAQDDCQCSDNQGCIFEHMPHGAECTKAGQIDCLSAGADYCGNFVDGRRFCCSIPQIAVDPIPEILIAPPPPPPGPEIMIEPPIVIDEPPPPPPPTVEEILEPPVILIDEPQILIHEPPPPEILIAPPPPPPGPEVMIEPPPQEFMAAPADPKAASEPKPVLISASLDEQPEVAPSGYGGEPPPVPAASSEGSSEATVESISEDCDESSSESESSSSSESRSSSESSSEGSSEVPTLPDQGDCVDSSEHCPAWADQGACEDEHRFWMLPNCQVSCGSCGMTVGDVDAKDGAPDCANAEDLCEFWNTLGECEVNPTYMHHSCALSCGTCGQDPPTNGNGGGGGYGTHRRS